jgi:peptidyl-prolyl cis-trans isomerase C
MKLPAKVVATILVVVALAGGLLLAQQLSSGPARIHLTAKDMELLVSKFPPDQLSQLASNPSQKQSLVDGLRKALAIGAVAEAAGYGERPAVQWLVGFQSDSALATNYKQKHPDAAATDDEITRFNQTNPQAFDDFLQYYPDKRFQQATGPQKEQVRKAFGEVKVLAARGRSEGLAKDRATQLLILINKYDILSKAYNDDLQNDDKLVTDADIDRYYKAHPDEFTEVHARHILISTTSNPSQMDDDDKTDEKKPKALTTDEARKKAESILQRIRTGEDFATLAKDNSNDPRSKANGGDLGYVERGQMGAEFDQAAFSLKPGEVSGIVETRDGFDIIRVEAIREVSASDAKVRQQMTDKLKKDAIGRRLDQILKDSKVSVADNFEVQAPPAGMGQMPAGHP